MHTDSRPPLAPRPHPLEPLRHPSRYAPPVACYGLALGFLLAGGAGPCWCSPAASVEIKPDLERFEFTEPEMGVPFRIVLYAPDTGTAKSAAQAAFDRVAQLN